MQNKKVSILVVTYNAEKFIKKTIQSCLNQRYNNFEILVLDNNSKDRTVEIIKRIDDDRIVLFESDENLGPYGGLNFLLDRASGEYIAIQDHDDIWFPEKIKKQVEFLDKNKEFVACGTNTFYYYESRGVLILAKKNKIVDFVDHTSLMFRDKNFRYNVQHSFSDEHFEKVILFNSGKIACLQEVLAVHRIRSDGKNLSVTRFKLNLKNLREYSSLNKNIFDTINLLGVQYLPDRVLWLIRRRLSMRNYLWLDKREFLNKYDIII